MNLNAFLTERTPIWEALEEELRRGGGHPGRLGPEGALELGRNYRATVADLALARRRFPGDPVIGRLEALVLAGRQAIYARRRRGGSVRGFIAHDYWRLVLGRPGVLAVALLALFGPCLIAAVWALHDPGAALGLVPGRFKGAAHPHLHHLATGAASQAALAGSIFTNNIEVTFLAFAGGLILGLGTLVVLAYNGVLLGVLAGLTLQSGSFSVFLRYVVPHGLLELSCIALAGAAGLRLAWAIIDPGTLPRGASLRSQARPAVMLVLGTAPFLVVAGLTEGFVTPRGLPLDAALAVGLGLGLTYWLLAVSLGRRRGAHSRARAFARR
ncbi:MAG TPA: stage II sporulation protein M [Solirubrobacteraceae bacterium]|nr:stage II sporulation protein M [Solirubrobacteraceae bacterium]